MLISRRRCIAILSSAAVVGPLAKAGPALADEPLPPGAIDKDGIIFQTVVEQIWVIPDAAAATPIRLALKVTNNTKAALRFSRFDTLHVRLTKVGGAALMPSGGRDATRKATAADFPLVKPGESVQLPIDAKLFWDGDKLHVGGGDGFGGVWGFREPLERGPYELRILYVHTKDKLGIRQVVAGKPTDVLEPAWAGEVTTPVLKVGVMTADEVPVR